MDQSTHKIILFFLLSDLVVNLLFLYQTKALGLYATLCQFITFLLFIIILAYMNIQVPSCIMYITLMKNKNISLTCTSDGWQTVG